MILPQPPRLATALLRWMGPRDEAMIGDLFEYYSLHRSGAGYWRQVVVAIAVGAFSEVRTFKRAALRAVLLGWLVCLLYVEFAYDRIVSVAATVMEFDQFLFVTGLAKWFYRNGIGVPDALAYIVGPLIVALGWCVSGWAVGRVSRPHGPAMVLAYVATVGVLPSFHIASFLADRPLSGEATVLAVVTYGSLSCTSSLIGGLWACRPPFQRTFIA